MIVVSDTSPITNLALIGQLTLLQQLYGTIVIPQAVAEEIAAVIPRLTNTPAILRMHRMNSTPEITNVLKHVLPYRQHVLTCLS